jgi:hypothetical protein
VTATCAWCGAAFRSTGRRGPASSYCSRSHRQRSYEARRAARVGGVAHPGAAGASLGGLAEALAMTRQAVAVSPASLRVVRDAYQHLAAAVAGTLSASPPATAPNEPVTVTDTTPPPGRTGRRTPKPWKVAFHGTGAEPAAGEIISAHTTVGAAESAARRYGEAWTPRQIAAERPRWAYSVVADPEDRLAGGYERTGALARAARLVVRAKGDEAQVVYRRRPDPRRAGRIEVTRHDRMLTEALAERWHAGSDAYLPSRFGGEVELRHPYAVHLVQDACGLAYLASVDGPRQRTELWDALASFAAEVLDPRGDTYEVTAAEILAWLEARGVVAVVARRTQ